MTSTPSTHTGTPPEVAHEIAVEQAHVDRVYEELSKAAGRASLVEADGMARGRTDRTGDVRDEELTGLFERDALVFNAARRRTSLETQHEGLVFGRLDLEHTGSGREVRYIGRLGVRDDDYEPLVIDWRAPAASPFYRATPVEPMDVLRRRVLRCRSSRVVGVEDDLMVAEAPEDLTVVGDGALLAALTRTRGARMRDIVATIQRHQDEAIRASARGVTEITGGPGTGKTVVALHRAAYLLYSERRRFEAGGILVVGPSAAYTAYIERVLPSLGEDSVALRSLGDVVDGITATRLDDPATAAVKGSLRIRRVLRSAARGPVPSAPTELRTFVAGHAVRIDARGLDRVRRQAVRTRQRNLATKEARELLAEAAWQTYQEGERADFLERFHDSLDVDAFMRAWWPQLDPREVLLWLADEDLVRANARGQLDREEVVLLAASMRRALELGTWSVADAALVDELSVVLGPRQEEEPEERGFYEVEELDRPDSGVRELGPAGPGPRSVAYTTTPAAPRERLLQGTIGMPSGYAHVLVDEAQDLSPMQWRMIGRRGRTASWTVVGDTAQASWPDLTEARTARDEAFDGQRRQTFHMDTNYRNAREIFDLAASVILPLVPDADIPRAVRETGVAPVEVVTTDLIAEVARQVEHQLTEVDGSIAIIAAPSQAGRLQSVTEMAERVLLIDPMASKGLEYDATVVVDPDRIRAEMPGGVRVLYVALTRAAHRMSVVRPG